MTTDAMISWVIEREGGAKFTDDPADRGGATKFGITAATLGRARRQPSPADVEEVKKLTESEARQIYYKHFLSDPGFFAITQERARWLLFDAAVQHSVATSVHFLQRSVGADDDGVLGPATLVLAKGIDEMTLCARMIRERLSFYGRLISKNLTDKDKDGIPDNTEFAWGWMNRMGELIVKVLA